MVARGPPGMFSFISKKAEHMVSQWSRESTTVENNCWMVKWSIRNLSVEFAFIMKKERSIIRRSRPRGLTIINKMPMSHEHVDVQAVPKINSKANCKAEGNSEWSSVDKSILKGVTSTMFSTSRKKLKIINELKTCIDNFYCELSYCFETKIYAYWKTGPINTMYGVPPQAHLQGQTRDNSNTRFFTLKRNT